MTIATFDPAQTSGDELRRSYVESGYVLVTGLVDEAARAEITRELRRINRGDYSRSPIAGVTWRDQIEPVDWPEDDERLSAATCTSGSRMSTARSSATP